MHLTVILAVGVDSALISTHRAAWQSAGYVVIPTESTREAIAHFRVGDFDVVLLGQAVPKEDKEKLAFLVRASGSRTPVICLAGDSGNGKSFADAAVKSETKGFELLAGLEALLAKDTSIPDSRMAQQNISSYDENDSQTSFRNKDTESYAAKRRESFSEGENRARVEGPSTEARLRRARSAPCTRAERDDSSLSAQDRSEDGNNDRDRSVIPMDSSHARIGSSDTFHSNRRAVRPDFANWRLGAARSVRTSSSLGVDAGLPARTVAVNISALQLQEENFLKTLFAILNETGLDPSNLELDVAANILIKAS